MGPSPPTWFSDFCLIFVKPCTNNIIASFPDHFSFFGCITRGECLGVCMTEMMSVSVHNQNLDDGEGLGMCLMVHV